MRCRNSNNCANYDEIECDDLLKEYEEQHHCYKEKQKEYENE